MKAIATQIKNILSADTIVDSLVSGRIYWGLGKQKEKELAIIFSVEEIIQGATADTRRWGTTIRCYGPDLDQVSDLYEAARNTMKSEGHQFKGGSSGITDEEDREGVAELTFELS
nr:hypothetical protein [Allomuricauda sp.]